MSTAELTTTTRPSDEAGAITVLFALLVPLTIMMIGAIVITVGSWYTHARQLQTRADAGALAGGGVWSFPCAPDVDLRIRDTARAYVGSHTAADGTTHTGGWNHQVGGIGADRIFLTLNQPDFWDDTFPGPDFTAPVGSACESGVLDVKVTEDDSPLLWGWIPFLPDIKRKARVELEEAHGLTDVLPIAVRVPKPVSSAAVIYDEEDGSILSVRYFEDAPDLTGVPAGLERYTTRLSGDPEPIGSLPDRTGVAIALSFRPACGTPGASPPCFEDDGFADVDALCNQGSGTGIVKCYQAAGNWPGQDAETGLHFIRSYSTGDVGNGPPELRDAYLTNATCEANGYFNSFFVGSCTTRLSVAVDLGSAVESVGGGGGDDDDDDDDGGGGGTQETRKASNVEVKYRLVRADGTAFCDYGASCELQPSTPDATGTVTYSTQGNGDSQHPLLTAKQQAHAIAIQIRVKDSPVSPNPGNCGVTLDGFDNNCRWFHVGSGIFGTSVEPTEAQIVDSPVQRAFMGDIDLSGPVKWLRLAKDVNCDDQAEVMDDFGPAASHPTGSQVCFYVDMGLRGGMARDQDEPPFTFNEGTGPSQMGALDCDPAIGQGEVLTDGVVDGCGPFYASNTFNTNPLCPAQNQFFTLPKSAPFDDWPPIDCVKTRPGGSMNQLLEGLNRRVFGIRNNPTCPPDNASGYVRGRNYWHRANNLFDFINYRWDHDTPGTGDDTGNNLRLDDPRLVTLFFTPYDSFTGSGQETFPIVSLGAFYITGWGRLNGNGTFQGGGPEDPCSDGNNGDLYDGTGNEPPPDLNSVGGSAGGTVVWGHFLKYVPQGSSTTGGTGKPCDPDSLSPCVAVLVE